MEGVSAELGANKTGGVNGADCVQAKRKRMFLAEVYVHKSRKLDADAGDANKFEVFHIYEFEDNENTKITPKLSTNCTEPRKIIEVLQNTTGSDTPQLQRLIDKLCAQNKKWTDILKNQSSKTTTGNDPSNGITSKTPTPPPVGVVVPTASMANVVAPQTIQLTPLMASAAKPNPTPATTLMSAIARQTPTPPQLGPIEIIRTAPQTMQKTATTQPIIRVKAMESLREKTPSPVVNAPSNSNPVKIVNGTLSFRQPNEEVPIKMSQVATTNKSSAVGQQTYGQKVTLWNKVINNNKINEKPLELLVITNGKEVNKDKDVFCLKPTEANNIENATNNSSSLKIGQVFECVSDEFVEDLLGDKRTTAPSPNASPPLDTLVKEISSDQTEPQISKRVEGIVSKTVDIGDTSAHQFRIVHDADENCFDYRCNECLKFNETFPEFKTHMFRVHQYPLTCQKCHQSFITRQNFQSHLSNGICTSVANSNRSFVCIVDPPVILMKNNYVFAFRCKHCNLAFKKQKNYVQHAQRHARMFRCKRCRNTKALSLKDMQSHLKKHEESDLMAIQYNEL